MDLESAQNNDVAKLSLLKQSDYEMWKLRIEQYFQVQYYALWDVIENDNSFNPLPQTTANTDGTSTSTIPDLEQIHEDDLEEMDLKWQLALLSIRARSYFQRTGKKITINGSDTAGYDKTKVPVALEVGAAVVALHSGVLELDTHSSSKANPLESSPPPISIAPMVSPFLCSDDSESDTEIPDRHISHTTSTPEILTAPILPTPSIIVAPPSEFPLALVVAPPRIHHSSSEHPSSSHSLSRHTPPDTTDIDSSTPQRFVHPPLARTLRCSEAYLSWRSAPLSTMSPAATVTLPIYSTRDLVPSRADLLPPRKRFRDSISPKDSVEEDIDTDVLDDIEADATAVEVGVDMDVGIDIPNGMLMSDTVERLEQVEEGLQNIHDHVIDIPFQMIEDIKTAQRKLEAGQLIASGERAGLFDNTRSLERENLKEEFCQVRKDRDDTRKRLRRLESFVERRLGFHP
nr:putative zinc finger, CCHC-type [Tanacetum cinerariifolium]